MVAIILFQRVCLYWLLVTLPPAVLQRKSAHHHPAGQYPSSTTGHQRRPEINVPTTQNCAGGCKWTNMAMSVVLIISPNGIIDSIITTVY